MRKEKNKELKNKKNREANHGTEKNRGLSRGPGVRQKNQKRKWGSLLRGRHRKLHAESRLEALDWGWDEEVQRSHMRCNVKVETKSNLNGGLSVWQKKGTNRAGSWPSKRLILSLKRRTKSRDLGLGSETGCGRNVFTKWKGGKPKGGRTDTEWRGTDTTKATGRGQ